MKLLLLWCIATIIRIEVEAYRRVCYYASWAIYRKGPGHFQPDYIDPHLCTHINYAFVGVNEDGSIKLFDAWNDIGDSWHKGQIQRLHELKKVNPSLKLLISCGGWNFGSQTFSQVAHSAAKRKRFADSAAEFVKKYGYDGFDLDWEYPGQRAGSQPSDKEAFVQLLQAFRQRFDRDRLLLTAATASAPGKVGTSYSPRTLSKYLDFINIMSYDLHGAWDRVTGHNSPLHFGSYLNKVSGPKDLYDEAIVEFFIRNGADPQKMNLGVPFYARTFTLRNNNENGFGAPTTGPGRAGTYYSEPGNLAYNEICHQQKQNYWTNHFDSQQAVPYSVRGDQWIGYDDERSLRLKAQFLKSRHLGGVMVWSIETDDFAGTCFGRKFPLLNVLKQELP